MPVVKKSMRSDDSLNAFATQCAHCLDALYVSVRSVSDISPAHLYLACVTYIIRMLAVLMAAERIRPQRSSHSALQRAADAIYGGRSVLNYEKAADEVEKSSGLAIFANPDKVVFNSDAFEIAAQMLTRLHPTAPIDRIYFETMPLSWLGSVYQSLLAFCPDESGERLQASRSYRKRRRVFFTPPSLVSYVIDGVLTPIAKSRANIFNAKTSHITVLDPAMGGGDFLTRAIDLLCEWPASDASGRFLSRSAVAAECVYGVDVDPRVVEIARFGVWASSGFAEGIADSINSHLICANALGARHADEPKFDWAEAFFDVFADSGFDAVVGNPPYIAAKNGLQRARVSGQSDSYLLFLAEIMESKLVKPGGLLSMVLPDPMLVRENAADVRRKIATEWSIVSLLHISEAFADALVANIVPIMRNAKPTEPTFTTSRIERAADRRSFISRPRQTAVELAQKVRFESIFAQDRCELLYLLEQGAFGDVIRRIHGPNAALSNYCEPFVPLRKLNIKAIYRGEEVGKSAINRETGDQPVLLGGQSIQPYEIIWEGRKASISWVRKPLERYHSTKILIQKSSAHIVAALDCVSESHSGYVFPQSIYAVELTECGIDPIYLLCLLNSEVLNEYIHRTVTGYKLLQPQLELEDIRALPIHRINFNTHILDRESETARGIDVFESESLHSGGFAELANFVVGCMTCVPEKSDVIHDVLVHLGREMVMLISANRKSPDADATRRLESLRTAIETVVRQLYSSDPTQMALPW